MNEQITKPKCPICGDEDDMVPDEPLCYNCTVYVLMMQDQVGKESN